MESMALSCSSFETPGKPLNLSVSWFLNSPKKDTDDSSSMITVAPSQDYLGITRDNGGETLSTAGTPRG